ncbi:MAG: TonB C-terminal domain-containing protein [Alphaproteobacteria bacterium]|nr:TonB C-terminal domain-containing protein [Alphaproteobacteria bacterium]
MPPPVEKKPAPEAPAAATSPPPRPLNKPRREIKPAFDPTRIAALLDKTKRDETPPPPAETPEPAPQAEAKPTPRLATLSARLAMTELDALRAQIERCWSVPAGAREAQDMAVVVRIYLKPDGRLSRDPQVLQSARMSDPFFRTMAESALRAVRKCEPLRVLSGNYEMWREIDLTFNPKDMLGG